MALNHFTIKLWEHQHRVSNNKNFLTRLTRGKQFINDNKDQKVLEFLVNKLFLEGMPHWIGNVMLQQRAYPRRFLLIIFRETMQAGRQASSKGSVSASPIILIPIICIQNFLCFKSKIITPHPSF
jgi:hypothetical protein